MGGGQDWISPGLLVRDFGQEKPSVRPEPPLWIGQLPVGVPAQGAPPGQQRGALPPPGAGCGIQVRYEGRMTNYKDAMRRISVLS